MSLEGILKYYPEIKGIHPACSAVPPMNDAEFNDLSDSVSKNGLEDDIILTQEGFLLDGRHRLQACFKANVEVRFKRTGQDPWEYANLKNVTRRHLSVGQRAMFARDWMLAGAKEQVKVGRPQKTVESRPQLNGKSRDIAGSKVGVSGKSVDKADKVASVLPDKADQVRSGSVTLDAAYREARKHEEDLLKSHGKVQTANKQATVIVVTHEGTTKTIAAPKVVRFNKTNDNVDWARWTWNPVTGCNHGCEFCYAREIAHMDRMSAYYPNKFTPTFHEYRLAAPRNTPIPESGDERDGRVFVCSMSDLFGKWVPIKWIRDVFDACLESPEWEYLFLTKWPAKYSQVPLIDNAWYGASIVSQSDVKRVSSAMKKIESDTVVRWVSMEPMLEPIHLEDLSWCDLMVIGSQTATQQPFGHVPAFAPEFDWIVDVVNTCREQDVPYYLKENLGLMHPGMRLPKGHPVKLSGSATSIT